MCFILVCPKRNIKEYKENEKRIYEIERVISEKDAPIENEFSGVDFIFGEGSIAEYSKIQNAAKEVGGTGSPIEKIKIFHHKQYSQTSGGLSPEKSGLYFKNK